ncbi:MAG: C39 family peptidase [Clostridiales bacterium]|jgi:hypothetical protein|nr:C39 family peptidase [Clostridiales bacterium]
MKSKMLAVILMVSILTMTFSATAQAETLEFGQGTVFTQGSSNLANGPRIVTSGNKAAALAQFVNRQESIASMLQKHLVREGITANNVHIGDPFSVQGYEEDTFFPVITDGSVVTLICISYSADEVSISIGKYFSEALNDLDDGNVYAIVPGSNIFLDAEAIEQPSASANKTIINDEIELSYFKESIGVLSVGSASANVLMSQGSGSWLYNYPIVSQTSSYGCWAAAISCILAGKGVSKTPAQVAAACGNTTGGATPSQVRGYLANIYGYSHSSYLGYGLYGEYVTEITAGRAIYQSFQPGSAAGTSDSHATVVMGYCYDSVSAYDWITIMDPATAAYYDVTFLYGSGNVTTPITFNTRPSGPLVRYIY